MRNLGICTGKSRMSPFIKNGAVSWSQLVTRLSRFAIVDYDYSEYMALDRDVQATIKDVGYFIGGQFNSKKREQTSLAYRAVITLDIDHLLTEDINAIDEAYGEYEYFWHTTLKHDALGGSRLRLVFPLAENVEREQYEPIARKLAAKLGMDIFDDTTFQPARIMFWPAVTQDQTPVFRHNTGEWVNPADILAEYEDWQDFAAWPCSSRVGALTHRSDSSVEDPLSKDGVVGAFCRTYDIHAAITHFELPYETTDIDNRYRPFNATGPSGAVVYDEGLFLYSHHESDPAGMQNVNAWDLVRLHKFGDYTKEELTEYVPVMQRASNIEMSALALLDPNVRAQMEGDLTGEMVPLENPPAKTPPPAKKPPAEPQPDFGEELEAEMEAELAAAEEAGEAPEAKARLTFETISREIAALEASSTYKECSDLIPRIAAARLDPVENGVLAQMLKDKWPLPAPTKKNITDQISVAHKRLTAKLSDGGEIADIEESLVGEVLNEHWAGGDHIVLTGKLFWDFYNGVWIPQEDDRVRGMIQETLKRLRKERPEDVMNLVAAVGDSKTSTLAAQLYTMMRGQVAHSTERVDPLGMTRRFLPPVMNCSNGEIWFDLKGNFEFHPHDASNYFTHQLAAEYDPKAECPIWDEFMGVIWSECIDPEEMTRHLEEFGGYCLQMSRWLKTWVLFKGPKDAGKSTVMEVISTILGKSVVNKDIAAYDGSNSHAEAGLVGKLLLLDDDFGKSARLPDGFIKKISEEKALTANPKSKDEFQFIARLVPTVCSNWWPATSDTSDAFVERAKVFNFNHKLTDDERDDQKKARMISDELPGILNRFIAGFARLRERGSWDVPIDGIAAHAEWTRNSNPAHMFVSEMVARSDGDHIRRSDIYRIYKMWCQQGNFRAMGKQHFSESMAKFLGPITKNRGHLGFTGWKLLDGEIDSIEDEINDL